jgi:hypothetical protein
MVVAWLLLGVAGLTRALATACSDAPFGAGKGGVAWGAWVGAAPTGCPRAVLRGVSPRFVQGRGAGES